ncbi:hypothetical protein LUZ61_007198 [Rhynchospora tenuis]|uniref:Maf-like protein n=1 Tax=Rhynchospora tenuis TaxID=198213 RepID=A0AAD5ZT72_9POAL|nr:hypothetical protein LUZ61_007198 [Rhynchospora tenuis]
MASFKIILGSSSASRKQILSEMGYQFTVMGADIDEKLIRKEKAEDLVMALAEAKADAIIAKLKENGFEEGNSEPTILITADQVVLHGGEIREKPRDADEARQFIKGYSKGHASTVGSVMVTNLKTGVRKGDWEKAEIYFHEIPEEVIDDLIKEGDVLYVAGGLMVEHPLTSPFVEAMVSSHPLSSFVQTMVGTIDSVMGLPKALTERLIKEAIQDQ